MFFCFFFIKSEAKFRHKNRNYPLLLFMPNENAVLSKFLVRQLLGSCDTECFRLIMSSATGLSKRTYLPEDEIQFQELSIAIRVFYLFNTFLLENKFGRCDAASKSSSYWQKCRLLISTSVHNCETKRPNHL